MSIRSIKKPLRLVLLLGNTLFILWVLINGVKENFKGTEIEKLSYCLLLILLVLNSYFILKYSES